VLFLGGLGRSGTTLVERVLGAIPGACPLGEVVHLWRRDVLRWALPADQRMLVGALAAPRLDVYGCAARGWRS
jgi:hypothetical protein